MPEEILAEETSQVNKTSEQPFEQTQPQKTPFFSSKILITIGAILVVITLVITVVLMVSSKTGEQDSQLATTFNSTPIIAPTLSPEDLLQPPDLYPEFAWKETDPTIPLNGPILYIDYEPIDTSFPGKEWQYNIKTVNSFEELHTLRLGFDNHYGQEINRLGWDNRVEYKGKKVQVLVADGPSGGSIGYAKIVGDKMRVIMLEDNTAYRGKSTNERPFSCPCDIDFTVFVSDIFSTSELEK